MGKKLFYNEIKDATEERDIELIYKNNLKKYFTNSIITYPFKCDGYLEETIMYDETRKVLRLIMEFKYGLDFNIALNRAKVLVQIVFYLKQFELKHNSKYTSIPNVILAGDKTTCFVISTSDVEEYLKKDLDWSIPPSEAAIRYKEFTIEISKNDNLNPIIFNINKKFKFENVAKDIKRLILQLKTKLKITESNLSETYDYFIEKIIRTPFHYSASDLVQCFIDVILGDVEISDKKGNKFIAKKDKRIEIDLYNYNKFEEEYATKYSIEEKNRFISIKDRLTEDTKRRINGEFFTPTIWVNEANKQLDCVLGTNWRDEYIVWDCAWGTGNLTRDYYFKELFCSTIDKVDIELGYSYNRNSTKFVYDFLNDDEELLYSDNPNNLMMPKKLFNALKSNKKVLFFINPPFGESSNGKKISKKSKDGISNTKVKTIMEEEKLKDSSQQLYIQFLYRIVKFKNIFNLSNVNIGIFTPTLFLSGERSERFRSTFLENFKYERGIVFNASYFSNVSSEWGVGFSIWSSGKNNCNNEFEFEVKDLKNNGKIETVDKKVIYNLKEDEKLSSWIKNFNVANKVESITLKSAINLDSKTKMVSEKAIGFLMNDSNNVYANTQGVYILSAPVTRHVKTTVITKENYKKCFSLFTARKVIKSTWINQKDNYIIPNVNDDKYKEFENDSIIYTLFSQQNSICSFRDVELNNKQFNIINNMFFMSISEILELANITNNEVIYYDCKRYNKERFLYGELQKIKLSNVSKSILNMAQCLVIESFKYRDSFNKNFSKYQINNWDSGWYQLRCLLAEYMNKELEEFNKMYIKLEDKLREQVYDLGFLK